MFAPAKIRKDVLADIDNVYGNSRRFHASHIGKAISVTIYVMLFFLGVKIGQDENILGNLSSLGLQALLLAFAGAAGSVIFASLLYRLLKR